MSEEFDLPVNLFPSLQQLITSYKPYRITGRSIEVERVPGMVVTLYCSDQREGDYKSRFLVIGGSQPILIPKA